MFGCASSAAIARVAVLEIDVVDQDAHPDAAVGGAQEVVGQDAPGRVAFPEEVLDVEGPLARDPPGPRGR